VIAINDNYRKFLEGSVPDELSTYKGPVPGPFSFRRVCRVKRSESPAATAEILKSLLLLQRVETFVVGI